MSLTAFRGLASSVAQPAPAPRWGHAMAYDAARDRVVLFGGAPTREEMFGDTWEWDGSAWKRIETVGRMPSPRAYAAMTYDNHRNVIVLHGGRDAARTSLDDTWEWDGAAWRRVATGGPPGLDHHALVHDETRGVSVLFGGWDGEDVRGETWTWDGRAWEHISAAGPPPRAAFAMAWHPGRESVILYGGLWIGGLYADAWAWDGQTWRVLTELYANPTLDHHSAAYDESTDRLLLFGGKNYRSTALDRLYELQGSRNANLQVLGSTLQGSGPAARYNTALVYDSKRRRMVLFGGRVRRGEDFIPFGDTWVLSDTVWTDVSPGE